MPAETVSPKADFEEFAAEQVKSGRYANAREVLDAAKAALARQKRYEEKLAYLKQAIQEGIDSGVYEGDAFADVRRAMGWESKR
jgi:putative addiction module CopG family antidote